MSFAVDPISGKLVFVKSGSDGGGSSGTDHHAGHNEVDSDKSVIVEAKKEMRISYLINKGTVLSYGQVTVK